MLIRATSCRKARMAGMPTDAIREHLARALDWKEAHATFDQAVEGIPPDNRGALAPGFDHSAWQLLEHIRLAQDDLLAFCRDADYVHNMKWPDDYWPNAPAPPDAAAWDASVRGYKQGVDAFRRLIRETSDLAAPVPTGKPSQTHLRSILLLIDHTAYHLGQI